MKTIERKEKRYYKKCKERKKETVMCLMVDHCRYRIPISLS